MLRWRDGREIFGPYFEAERIGFITDFDGTLSPIVDHPDDAAPTDGNQSALLRLQEVLSLVAVVSGRAAADVRDRLGIPELVYVGNHGMERWRDGSVVPAPQVEGYRPALEAIMQDVADDLPDGMWIEDKQVTLSVHYRKVANPDDVRQQFAPRFQALAQANGIEFSEGRKLFELKPPVEINKGTIFRDLVAEYNLQAALFIGDDVTDASAMQMARMLRDAGTCYALAVGVESADTPAVVLESADVLVSDVEDVEAFLSWLFDMASSASTN